MIIDKIYFINKKEKILAIILSAFILTLLIALLIVLLVFAEKLKNSSLLITITIALICTFSISDVYSLVKGNLTIGHRLLRGLKKSEENNPIVIVPTSTALQNMVCKGVCHDKGLESLVHIYGFPGRGKTTTAFFILRGIFLNTRKSVTQIKEIMFIDCSLNKQKVLNLFHSDFDKEKRFDDTIVILDNIEQMGTYFLEINRELFMSNKNLFILIEDTDNGKTRIQPDLLKLDKQYDFNNNRIEHGIDPQLWIYVDNLPYENKFIFFTIYLGVYYQKYMQIKHVAEISKSLKEQVYKLLRNIEAQGKEKKKNVPFAIFPFNKEYVYCSDVSALEIIPQRYIEDEVYKNVLYTCIQSNHFNKEGKWLCFIQCNSAEIEKNNQNERIHLFNKALSLGHFKLLYNALEQAVRIVPEKQHFLFYEYGVLCYYMGFHSRAFNLYQNYLQVIDKDAKMRMLIRIIESVHGSSDDKVVIQIQKYINVLKEDPFYKLYADYWLIHIGIEKGIFDIPSLLRICSELEEMKPIEDDFLYIETVKRCYTDLIRCHHLLGLRPNDDIEKRFESFLKNINEEMYKYSFNLYIRAGNLQYIDIPHAKFEDNGTKVRETVGEANSYYNDAISSEYGDQKSRLALAVKKEDLNMALADTNIKQAIRIAEYFLMHAQNNNAKLHEAFANTILAKFKILDSNNIFCSTNTLPLAHYFKEDIEKHIKKARNTYIQYKNIYGVFRLDFIQLMYMLYTEIEYTEILELMQELTEKHASYVKEYAICIDLQERNQKRKLTKMYIMWCIRSYMIVLQ